MDVDLSDKTAHVPVTSRARSFSFSKLKPSSKKHPDVTASAQERETEKRKLQIWLQTDDSFFFLQQFERDMRRFARKERRMLLDNHGLFDKNKVGVQQAGASYATFTKPNILREPKNPAGFSVW